MRAGVPIVIGLQSEGDFTGPDGFGLREFFEAEFRARSARYPNSPFLFYVRATPTLTEIASTAAAACGIPVFTPPAGTLALFCHLLFDISVHTDENAEVAAIAAEPLEGDLLEFEAELKVEVIRLRLLTRPVQLRQKIARFGVDEPVRDQLFHPPAENRLMVRTDRFNQDAAAQAISPVSVKPSIEALYRQADALAMDFQGSVRWAFRWIFLIAGVGAAFYGVYLTLATNYVSLQVWMLGLYVGFLVVSYLFFLRARSRDLHSRFVEYRALAEGLRVQHYWHDLGVTRATASCYLIRQPLEYQWIRLALWFVTATNPPVTASSAADAPAPTNVLKSWIDDQERYFVRSQAHAAGLESKLRIVVAIIFGIGLLAVFANIAELKWPLPKPWPESISFLGFLMPSVSAAIVAYVTKLGVLYQAQHYGRMQRVYDQARQRLRRHPAGATFKIAIALGEEALQENESWAQFRRERSIDEPASPFRRPW